MELGGRARLWRGDGDGGNGGGRLQGIEVGLGQQSVLRGPVKIPARRHTPRASVGGARPSRQSRNWEATTLLVRAEQRLEALWGRCCEPGPWAPQAQGPSCRSAQGLWGLLLLSVRKALGESLRLQALRESLRDGGSGSQRLSGSPPSGACGLFQAPFLVSFC